jgi:hypothetical protein
MTNFPKATFNHTDLSSVITEFVLAVTAVKDGKYYPCGTAIMIAPRIALTARHVIESCLNQIEDKQTASVGNVNGSFSLQFAQIQEGKTGALWFTIRVYYHTKSDIAIFLLTPFSEAANNYKGDKFPLIELLPPTVGSRIFGFGYHSQEMVEAEMTWNVNPSTTSGQVLEVFVERRDEGLLNFPCYRTNAKFAPGMSGGPIFNERGCLCGLMSSNLPPINDGEEDASFIATLWPMLAIPVDFNRVNMAQGVSYPVYELIKDGFIKAREKEKIRVSRDTEDNYIIEFKA